MNIDIDKLYEQGMGMVLEYGPKLLLAIVVLIIGLWLIKKITRLVGRNLDSREGMDPSLSKFLTSLISIILKVLLFVTVAGMVGVETTSFAAILAAMGLAIGMALQGSLGNFAGGVLLMLFKPFKIDDLIEAQGYTGVVSEISIFTTSIVTPDNKRVIIPNGPLSNGPIVNYTEEGQLRVDLVVGIGYDSDIRKAKEVCMKVMQNDSRVLKDPAPSVNVQELGGSSVDLAVRPFTTPEHYWGVYFDTLENVKIALDEAGVDIPFPQQVVHHVNPA